MNKDVVSAQDHIALADRWSAHNYHPLPVVLSHGEGAWLTDLEGRRYLDFLSGYSALNFGHRHPDVVATAKDQIDRLTLTGRAFHNDLYGLFCHELAELTGTEMVLPSNSGAEAVESALKVARKWGYQSKGIPDGAAEIVVADSNFHGRTITIVSFSTDAEARTEFGPFTPGFKAVPYGDAQALRAAVNANTAAVLLEPIQGEAGVVVPPKGYFAEVREICDDTNTLLIADEIQSGLARTGTTLALDHEGVRADMYALGKALGGGIVPVSAVVGRADVIGVLKPGEHGSTFAGNPLACAIGRTVIRLLSTGEFQERARELGAYLHARLRQINGVTDVRGRGLWASVHIADGYPSGRKISEALVERGLLCKDYHNALRVAPPLVITREEIDQGVSAISEVLG